MLGLVIIESDGIFVGRVLSSLTFGQFLYKDWNTPKMSFFFILCLLKKLGIHATKF